VPPLSSEQVAAWSDYNEAQWGRLRLDLLWTVLERHVPPPARVLDAGCGLAELALRFARAGSEVVAADASQAMVAEARRRAGDAPIRWLAADLDRTTRELRGERFDLVLCHNVLGYVPRPGRLLRRTRLAARRRRLTLDHRREPARRAVARGDHAW
jgi:2-polyprenyl-3-methyl-5-hydroxy-6-metoxy-1,4-benzoquinol methylase